MSAAISDGIDAGGLQAPLAIEKHRQHVVVLGESCARSLDLLVKMNCDFGATGHRFAVSIQYLAFVVPGAAVGSGVRRQDKLAASKVPHFAGEKANLEYAFGDVGGVDAKAPCRIERGKNEPVNVNEGDKIDLRPVGVRRYRAALDQHCLRAKKGARHYERKTIASAN